MEKVWEIYPEDPRRDPLSKKLNIDPLIIQILLNRGIEKEEEIEKFLKMKNFSMRDPFLLPDMEKGIKRVLDAIKNKEKILIYGDYDVDGITSVSIMILALKKLGAVLAYHIPNRFDEGYGLNKNILVKAYKKGVKLIITVDCGITSISEVELAKELGIDVVILDHHEQGDSLPDAISVIDPKREDSTYGFRELAGVGVVYKFIQALHKYINKEDENIEQFLDLVALGTIADIVPYLDENRYFVKKGLEIMNRLERPAIRALISVSNLLGVRIDEEKVSFNIAPRINAAGRISSASPAVKMFLLDDYAEVLRYARLINNFNFERREIENAIFKNALTLIEEKSLDKENVIVLSSTSWSVGVIGIVASRLARMFQRPVILFSVNNGIAQGSGRSVPGISIFDLLLNLKDILLSFGGHEQAVGLKLEATLLPEFKKRLKEEFSRMYPHKNIKKILKIDARISINDLNDEFIKSLGLLSPFGIGNPYPVFLLSGIYLDNFSFLKNGTKNLRVVFEVNNREWRGMGYDFGHIEDRMVSLAQKVDLVFGIKSNFDLNSPFIFIEDLKVKDENYALFFKEGENN